MPEEEEKKQTVGMLLDINNMYGEHQGRLAPWLYAVGLGAAPALIYMYLNAFYVFPIWLFVPLNIFWFIMMLAIFPGRQRYRVMIYKRQLNDDYMDSAELMKIKTIHPDGCIEFLNSNIMYLVTAFNGTSDDEVQSSVQLRKLLEAMFVGLEYDVHIHNINDSESLRQYYQKVARFDKNESASNFMQMIDHTIELTNNTSSVQQTIYVVHGYKSDWKKIKEQLDGAISSTLSRRYKTLYRVKDPDEISAIFNRDSDTIINIEALMRKKYADETYYNSKVLAYDLPDDQVIIQGRQAVEPIIKEAPKKSFHTAYNPVSQSPIEEKTMPVTKGPRRSIPPQPVRGGNNEQVHQERNQGHPRPTGNNDH